MTRSNVVVDVTVIVEILGTDPWVPVAYRSQPSNVDVLGVIVAGDVYKGV